MKPIAIAIALLALTAGAAHAFTYDGRGNLNADGTTRFTDPDDQIGDGTKQTKSKSGFSMKFSGGGPTETNGVGVENRFLPSRNGAFYSPFQQQNLGASPYNQN
jgi:hypothetical protein